MTNSELAVIPLLAIMEVSLSFDNAVMNASVLKRMSATYQKLFLTWGMLFAVFLVRLLLPGVIVSLSAGIGLQEVITMALHAPAQYAAYATAAHGKIAAFGGSFLSMVFFMFLFDPERKDHWLPVERLTSRLGRHVPDTIWAVLYTLAVGDLGWANQFYAVAGIFSFLIMEFLSSRLNPEKSAVLGGLAAFLYLEVLDASLSLDGVMGAFSMSSDILTIMIGLGIGAFAIRALTVYMVRRRTLEAFCYLEHGAHYAIGALGVLLLLSGSVHIPQAVTGLIGITFIGLSALHSMAQGSIYGRP